MVPLMRRVTGVAAICGAVGGVSVAPSAPGNHVHQHHRLLQSALFSVNSNNSAARSHWFSYNRIAADQYSRAAARAVSGTMFFSVAATALVEEVHAKEPVHSKFRPKDVLLYQYEACPFCNKVKGIPFRFHLQRIVVVFFISDLYIRSIGIAFWIRQGKNTAFRV